MRVLLTGANGFIGSHLGEEMHNLGWELIATKRSISNLSNAKSFVSHVKWVNVDNSDWKNEVVKLAPQIIIHCAWIGVSAENRNDINTQFQNIQFLGELLDIARICKVNKFIGLGSQAEYGTITSVADETYPVEPNTAYGIAKVASYEIIRHYCANFNIKWYWLRLFSFYGEREPDSWLIPSIVKRSQKGEAIDTTLGEQQYAYMYVKDLAIAICKLVKSNIESNLFVISARKTTMLKDLICSIRDQVNPNCQINYGSIPYRPNQSMIIKGDSSKFERIFGEIELTDFEQRLRIVVDKILND